MGKQDLSTLYFYNSEGATTILKNPSTIYYKKKINFEKHRIEEWL